MKKDLEVVGFKGPNTILLAVRIPEPLHEQLQQESKERGESVPDLVRKAISLTVLPGALSRQVSEGIEIAEATDSPVDGLKTYYADLSALIKEGEAAIRKAKAMKQSIRLIEKQVVPIFKRVFEKRMKQWQFEQESNEKERHKRKREQKLAGILEPESNPAMLTEDDMKGLTELQKKQHDLVF
jgi:hypothetical protein